MEPSMPLAANGTRLQGNRQRLVHIHWTRERFLLTIVFLAPNEWRTPCAPRYDLTATTAQREEGHTPRLSAGPRKLSCACAVGALDSQFRIARILHEA
jgi:hypothetical protein